VGTVVAETPCIAYDAGPAKRQPTGVGVYVRDLGRALAALYPSLLAFIGVCPDGPLAGLGVGPGRVTTYGGRVYQRWLHTRAEADARRVGATLVHYTNALAPLLGRLPFVLTVQDLSLIRYPHYHPVRRVASIGFMIPAVHRARAIIVPSHATRDELVNILRVRADKIFVIEHAPAVPAAVDPSEARAVLRRFNLRPGRYVLSVGTIEPRKNLVRLARAFAALAVEKPDLQLVVLGAPGWRTGSILGEFERSPVASRILVPGYVTDREREALMAACGVFAYVSLYEGYGLPVLEAMVAGVPVVTSNQSSMPQAAGGAAILVDPGDVAAIRRGLQAAFARREELVSAGRRRVSEATWERVASSTMEVYGWALTRGVARARRGQA
jgi:glycosyltransferase involved in cell wall biosynthesis